MRIKMVSLSSLAIVHSEIVLNFVFFPDKFNMFAV